MFRAALSYPSRKPDGPRSVLLGGGLVFLTSLLGASTILEGPFGLLALLGVLPWLALRGYYVRVVRTTIGRDRPTPPALDDAGRLLRDGLASVFISAVYLLPGLVVIGPLVYARAIGTDVGTLYAGIGLPTALANAALSATGFLALIAAMYLLGALYATPVAVAQFAYHDRVRSAFAVRRVVDGALTEDYAVAWAVALLLQVVVLPIAYVLRAALVGFFLHFVVAVGVRYCFGQGVGAGLELDPIVPDPDAPSTTPGDSRTPRSRDPGQDPMLGPDDRPDSVTDESSRDADAPNSPADAATSADGTPGSTSTSARPSEGGSRGLDDEPTPTEESGDSTPASNPSHSDGTDSTGADAGDSTGADESGFTWADESESSRSDGSESTRTDESGAARDDEGERT